MNVGSLELQLMAETAKFQRDMETAKGAVTGAVSSMQRDFDIAKGALFGLTGALVGIGSIAAFKGMVGDVIDFKVQLQRLSIQTGASVESLGAIGAVGKLTGTAIADIGGAMNKLSKNLASSTEESKGAAQAIKALGIDFDTFIRLSPDQQMLAVAKAMGEFADGGGKSAAAMLLFGKTGATLLPMLTELAEKNELVGKTTAKSAQEAEAYEKSMKKLEAAGNAWKREMVDGMLPTLTAVAKSMADARKEGTLLTAVMAGIQTLFTGDDRHKNNVAMVEETDKLLAQQKTLDNLRSRNYSDDSFAVVDIKKKIAATQELLKTTQSYRSILQADDDREAKRLADRAARPKLDESLGVKPPKDKPAAAAAGPYDAINKSIQERLLLSAQELTAGRALTEQEKFAIKVTNDVIEAKGKFSASQRASIATSLEELKAKDLLLQIDRSQVAAAKEHAAERQKIRNSESDSIAKFFAAQMEADNASTKALKDGNAALKEEIATIGLDEKAIIAHRQALENDTLAKKESELADLTLRQVGEDRANQLRNEIDLLTERRNLNGQKDTALAGAKANAAFFDEWKKGWEATDKLGRDVFDSWGQDGSSAAQKIGDTLKSALKSAIYEATLKPLAFQLYQGVTGALGMPGATGSLAQGYGSTVMNGASLFGQLGSAGTVGSQVLGGGMSLANGLGTLGANATGSGISGLLASNGAYGTAALAEGATAVTGAAGGLATAGGALSSALAAVPVWGWVALGALAIFGSGGKKNGVVTTGDSRMLSDASGKTLSMDSAQEGRPRSEWTDGVVRGLEATYLGMVKNLGIAAATTSFSFAGNKKQDGKDPKFSLGGGVYGKGGFYQAETEQTDAAMAVAASRAVFAALQHSEMPKYLAGVFDGLTASSATQQQITDNLALAQAYKGLHDDLQGLPLKELKDMAYATASGLAAASGGLDKFKGNVGTYYDKFYTTTEKTAAATANVARVFANLGETMPALDKNAHAAFRTLIEGFDLTVEADRKAYAALLGVSGAFDQLSTAADGSAGALASAISGIQGLVDGIHKSVGDSIFANRYGQLDNAGKYDMLDARGKGIDTQLRGTDDITQIAKLAADEIALLNQAFALLGPDQQKNTTVAFEDKLNSIDAYVTSKGADAIGVARAQAAETAATIAAAVKTAVAEAMVASSAAIAAAAASIQAAANVPAVANIAVTVSKPASVEVDVRQYSMQDRG